MLRKHDLVSLAFLVDGCFRDVWDFALWDVPLVDIMQRKKLLLLGIKLDLGFEVFGFLLLALVHDLPKPRHAFPHVFVDNVTIRLDKLDLVLEYTAPFDDHVVERNEDILESAETAIWSILDF